MQVYRPEAPDPESSGALASCLWELALLNRHFHPAVARLAADVAALASSRDATGYLSLTPTEAVVAYSTAGGGFRPGIKAPRKKGNAGGGGKRKPGLSDVFAQLVEESEVGGSGREGAGEKSVERAFRVMFREVRDHRENLALRREQRRVAAVRAKMRERAELQAKRKRKTERKRIEVELHGTERKTERIAKGSVAGTKAVGSVQKSIKNMRKVNGVEQKPSKQKKQTTK